MCFITYIFSGKIGYPNFIVSVRQCVRKMEEMEKNGKNGFF